MVVVARVAAVLLWLLSLAAGGEEEDHAAGSDRTSCAAADATAVLQEDADWFRVEVGAYFTDDLGGGGSGGGRNSSASSSARLVVSHDPHFSSAAGTVRSFCARAGGCDGASQRLLVSRLNGQVRAAAVEARRELRLALLDMASDVDAAANAAGGEREEEQEDGPPWFTVSDDTAIARHNARAADLRGLLLEGRLPLPVGDCLAPSDLQRSIGACPLATAQEALRAALVADGHAPEAIGPHLQPTSLVAWEVVCQAWFRSSEMAHAAAAYVGFLERARLEEEEEERGAGAHDGAANPTASSDSASSSEKSPAAAAAAAVVVVDRAALSRAEHMLGTVAASWGLTRVAERLLLGAAQLAESLASQDIGAQQQAGHELEDGLEPYERLEPGGASGS